MSLLDEIAKEAGVSTRTVSNVLQGRNKERWPSAVRRANEIRTIAERLGYLPNAAAKATATGRFGNVALVLSRDPHRSNLPQGLLAGIHDELASHDMHLTVVRLPDETLTDTNVMPKILRQWMVDGLLIDYNIHIPPALRDLISRHRLPAVWINSQQKADCVYPDDFGAGRRATQFLIEQGHKQIGFMDFSHRQEDADEHYSAGDRFAGYKAALREVGFAPLFLGDGCLSYAERMKKVTECLSRPDRPTALIGYGEGDVEFALLAALKLGLSVPYDVSLATFGSYAHGVADIVFTTFVVPELEVGVAAVQMLIEKIDHNDREYANRVIAFGFDPGTTCAPPHKNGKGSKT